VEVKMLAKKRSLSIQSKIGLIYFSPVFEQLGFKHNLKYGPRSKLRRACSRFLRFSYLLDFIALDALSSIYIDSVKDTVIKFKTLTNIEVDFELIPLKTAFGEQNKKALV